MNATTPIDPNSITREHLNDAVELELQARQDHLRLLAHTCCAELLELVRLRDKLAARSGNIAPLDCFKWIDSIEALEAARLRYAHGLRRYDGPAIIREAATSFAGAKIASVIESAMTQWRERLWAEAVAAQERERAAKG